MVHGMSIPLGRLGYLTATRRLQPGQANESDESALGFSLLPFLKRKRLQEQSNNDIERHPELSSGKGPQRSQPSPQALGEGDMTSST